MSVAAVAGGRYRLERRLGSGGMATVHLAYDRELRRPVAVKVLADHLARDADFRRRFLREARLAARLSHPHVVAIFDAGEEDGRPFIVMELVRGETLADLLARRGGLPADEVARLGAEAADGLAHAHARGLVHRDVKPQNLLIREDGTVKVADFGIARPATAAERLTEIGTVLGTAAYLPPEQAAGREVGPAADLYALGVVLYEALTGRTPYPAKTLGELLQAQEAGVVTPVRSLAPETPVPLEEVVMRCLARNPDYRPASAGEVARELASAAPEEATRALARPAPPGIARGDGGVHLHLHPTYVRVAAAAVALAAAATAITFGVLAATAGGPPPPLPPDRPGKPAQQARDLAAWLRAESG